MIYAIFLCYTASSCAELFQPGNWYVTCIIAKVELEHLATKQNFFFAVCSVANKCSKSY